MEVDMASFQTPSTLSTLIFLVIVAAVAACLPVGLWFARRRAGASGGEASRAAILATLGMAVWMSLTATAVLSGFLEQPGLPPRLMIFFGASNLAAIALVLSPVGRHLATLPLAALAGFQAFRLPLELVLHSWYTQGSIPVQMTWSGHNFDIVTGVSAVVVAVLLARRPSRALAVGFTVLGMALLVVVMAIATLSSPVPFRRYMNEPALLIGYHLPYAWIVPICVAGALAGHLVMVRALVAERQGSQGS